MNSLRQLRKDVFQRSIDDNKLKQDALKKIDIVCGFNNDTAVKITFEDLKLFKIGESKDVNNKVVFEKTYEDSNKMVFLTYMLDGGTFGIHCHNCWEFCKVLKGSLFEKTRGLNKVYGVGEIIAYSPDEKHIPYATQDSTYEVTFYKSLP